jgi:hypothetical protein
VLFHRWLGVAFCLLFASWFVTGAVLHFVPYPALADKERLARSPRIDPSRIAIAPANAMARLPDSAGIRLVSMAGRPAYVLNPPSGPVVAVSAETGALLSLLSGSDARAIAEEFQKSSAASVEGPLRYDQWIVAQQFEPFRPFFRVKFNDQDGTVLYVSARSGEVLQRTTFTERAWNWCGANIHWIYFSVLRINWSAWNQVVWWLSLVGLLVASAGVWLGVVRLAPIRRMPGKGLTPFRGWLGWHHRIGLFCGAFVLTWIFSGWLSMDHGRIFSTGAASVEQVSRLRGEPPRAIAEAVSLASLRAAGPASQILVSAVAGHPFLVSQGAGAPKLFWMEPLSLSPSTTIPESLLVEGVKAAWPGLPVSASQAVRSDSLYSLAESMPSDTVMVHISGGNAVDVYVNSITGNLVTVMDSSRRAYAWVFYALHTFKFPGLAARPILRHIAVLGPLLAGFVFCVTAIVIGVYRFRSTLQRAGNG